MMNKLYKLLNGKQTLTLDGQTLSISEGNSVTLPIELRGHGFPNGKFEGKVGDTYIDLDKTNGALKWIKSTEGGNTGWKVLIGDTGWVTMTTVSVPQGQEIQMRRVNDTVTFRVKGDSYGRLGLVGRGKPGYVWQRGHGNKGCRIIEPGNIIQGFRAPYSLQGTLFKDNDDVQKVYGSWYIGGESDANFMRLAFHEDIPESPINDMRLSPASWFTNDPYPTGTLNRG